MSDGKSKHNSRIHQINLQMFFINFFWEVDNLTAQVFTFILSLNRCLGLKRNYEGFGEVLNLDSLMIKV